MWRWDLFLFSYVLFYDWFQVKWRARQLYENFDMCLEDNFWVKRYIKFVSIIISIDEQSKD